MRPPDDLIVGGGPAGSAAAITLARAGRKVLIIERDPAPRESVCGGFLGWDSLAVLKQLGVDPWSLGARPIERLRLVAPGGEVEARLPHLAAGLSRRTLDGALNAAAIEAGAEMLRGRAVRAADPAALMVRLDDGEALRARSLLIATGKHELRGASRERDTAMDSVGIRTALATTPELIRALDGIIELHLFDGGYGGLLLQEDGTANLCLSVTRSRFKAAGGIEAMLAELAVELPELRKRIDQGEAIGWSAVSGVPYGWRARDTLPGVYRVGDQAAVIASLAGDGIAIALESGRQAGAAVIAGDGAEVYQKRFARRAARPLAIAERLRWAAETPAARSPMMKLVGALPALSGLAARLTRIAG